MLVQEASRIMPFLEDLIQAHLTPLQTVACYSSLSVRIKKIHKH